MANRWHDRGKLAMAGGLLCLMLAWGPAMAQAVSEEPIGASPRQPATAATSPAPPVELSPAPESAPVVTPPSAPDDAPLTADQSPAKRALQPHATFPYTIRPGDNLGAIAAEFGVTVADLSRLNHLSEEAELGAGETLRIPNPGLARERELTAQVNQLTLDQQTAAERAQKSEAALHLRSAEVEDLHTQLRDVGRDLRGLAWWRASAYVLGVAAALMFGGMMFALLDWWFLRNRFRAVAEMNEALRRLDYKYKSALAKAELRLQELYGRRRRGLHDGQERPKLAEEAEIERLNLELKAVLERHLTRLGPAGARARRVRWQERVSGIGAPVEAPPLRR